MEEKRYIIPITEVSPSFEEAKKQYAIYGHGFVFHDVKPTPIADLAQGNRTVIVGEPGIGKTELMKRIEIVLKSDHATKFIALRSSDSIKEIDAFIKIISREPKAIFLDALDEVPRSIFTNVLKKIQDISDAHPDIAIYVSSRWVFMEKYSNSFSSYRFIVVKPFTSNQIKEYLSAGSYSTADVDELFNHTMQFHGRVIVQIPRYLFLFEQYMEGKAATEVKNISRNELFEHFIYSKLSIEADRNEGLKEMESVIKRLLEKLALTMEIYQTNTISREELVTFFDNIKSDLKLMVLAQVGIDILIKNTVLQVSKDDADKIEFENAEFQEYLAAKEITRLSEPRRAAFSFAADIIMSEIYPSWYNTLSFLVDMDPDMLGQLLDYSGISGDAYKIVDENFLNFLSRINSAQTPLPVKKRLFIDVISYHNAKLQWLPGQITSALPSFYDTGLENLLKDAVQKAETKEETSTKYYVPLGNIAYAVAYLIRMKKEVDRSYWKEKFIHYASYPNENGVLPRHALFALAELNDSTVIDDISNLTQSSDELVVREFASMCAAIAPNNDKSVDVFIKLVSANDLHGRYGLFEVTELGALKRFLHAYISKEIFRKEFLDDSSTFFDQDSIIVDHIRSVADEELRELATEAVIKSLTFTRGKSAFVRDLIIFLRDKNLAFIPKLINRIHNNDHGNTNLYYLQDYLQDILRAEDIEAYIDAMLNAGMQQNMIMNTLVQIKWKDNEDSNAIYEAGRVKMPDTYRDYEEAQNRPIVDYNQVNDNRLISEFRNALRPAPDMFMYRVFNDYNSNAGKLEELMNNADRERFDTLIKQEALGHNPAAHGLTINDETDKGETRNYTTSSIVQIFGDALKSAKLRGINITEYRSNIACFIPFAHNEDLKTVFELVPNFTPDEINPVIDIYNHRETDLWRWQPDAFIEAASNYNLANAATVLRGFIKESRFRKYDREEALSVAESLKPDPAFLREIFIRYSGSENEDEKSIATVANGLLVTKYSDPDAITWRLQQVITRSGESAPRPRSGIVRDVTPLDHELHYGKEFAKPLMELKQQGLEDQYLLLLDTALELWSQGESYYSYAQYLLDIVFAYFDNLKEYGGYKPLQTLEEKLIGISNKQEGANWLTARIVTLRRSYLSAIGKPSCFAESIRKYNDAHEYDDKRIVTSADLAKNLQDALDTDLRAWIEGEGAYELILVGKVYKTKKQEYEKLIQKTIKTQIENAMLKRGFQTDVLREPDLLDDKRVDLLIRYGFVGPIILEVKLTSNSDIKARDISTSKSYKSLERYMGGYGAAHGIFLIIVNNEITSVPAIKEAFGKIDGVTAISIDCTKFTCAKPRKKKSSAKAVARGARKRTTKR